jgi:hypothetical protein
MPWTFLLDRAVLATFTELSKQERTKLMRAFDRLAEYPDDADAEWNKAGFMYHEKRFGDWDITYRLDGPVKHVLIVDLTKTPTRSR